VCGDVSVSMCGVFVCRCSLYVYGLCARVWVCVCGVCFSVCVFKSGVCFCVCVRLL